MRFYYYAIFSVLCNFLAQFLFKKIANKVNFTSEIILIINFFFKNVILLSSALIAYFFSAFFWLMCLKGLNLSKAFSITALNFILIPILSKNIFNEVISENTIIGIILIIFGILLVNLNRDK